MGIEMREGLSFSREFTTDVTEGYLVNEEVARLMGVSSVVGARFLISRREGKIIGIMKDFNYQSLRNTIEPLALSVDPSDCRFVHIRIQGGDIPVALDAVRSIWPRVLPRPPFNYQFLDENFDGMDLKEFSVLVVLASVLACPTAYLIMSDWLQTFAY